MKEVVERSYTHFITGVFEGESHSPLEFHPRLPGFKVIGQHLYGGLKCSQTRIILTLDMFKAHQRLRTPQNHITWCLTEGIRRPREAKLVGIPAAQGMLAP